MKVALTILVVCVAACLAETETKTSDTRVKRQSKPGRFLTLPVPAKCASRKCHYNFFVIGKLVKKKNGYRNTSA